MSHNVLKEYEVYLSRKITEKCHRHILLKNPMLAYPDQKIDALHLKSKREEHIGNC